MAALRAGILGCGNISSIYLENCTRLFKNLEIAAVADLAPERAKAQAARFGIPRCLTPAQLLGDERIEAVLDLTIPLAHAELGIAALEAGKHLYSEKPLATTLAEGEKMVALARQRSLMLGCAPDTFLGAGLQTCRELIDEGRIGQVVGATAFMVCGGHEHWHPDPAFYYKRGGGPMLDMGPYYLHALVSLLGPIAAVQGRATMPRSQRVIASEPKRGEIIDVEVPTTILGMLEFSSGASAFLMTSFDAPGGTSHAPIEIYGSEGTLIVPDPNTFGGPVKLRQRGAAEFEDLPLRFPYEANSRGLGLSDLAAALQEGRPARASGDLALHALEVMTGLETSSDSGQRYVLKHSCARPAPMPPRP